MEQSKWHDFGLLLCGLAIGIEIAIAIQWMFL